jgi:hypothetical protein
MFSLRRLQNGDRLEMKGKDERQGQERAEAWILASLMMKEDRGLAVTSWLHHQSRPSSILNRPRYVIVLVVIIVPFSLSFVSSLVCPHMCVTQNRNNKKSYQCGKRVKEGRRLLV